MRIKQIASAVSIAVFAVVSAMADITVSDSFLARIAYVESRGNPLAFNIGSGAYGMYQIRMPYLSDANKILGTDYTLEDMFDPEKAEQVVRAYLGKWGSKFEERHGRVPTEEDLARIHNGGPRGAERVSTLKYAALYNAAPVSEES